jgi:hypothetical protein
LAALFIAALTLVAAGCGGSSNNEASSDTTTVATDTTAATTDTGMTTETTATDTGTTGATGQGAPSGKCKDLAELGSKLSQSIAGQSGDLQDASKYIDELAGQVPDEIRPDFQIIARNFKKIAVALKGVQLQSGKTPSPQALAKLQQIVSSMDSAEVRLASAHIEAWAQKNC